MPTADPATFTIDIPNNYDRLFGKDAQEVYYNGEPVFLSPGFRIIDSGSNKDCGYSPYVVAEDQTKEGGPLSVFYMESDGPHLIEGADINTFVVLGVGYSKDKNFVYDLSEKTSYDPSTFDTQKANSFCMIG